MIRSQSTVIGELVLLEGRKEGELVLGPLHGDSVKDYSSPEASSQTSDMTKKKKRSCNKKSSRVRSEAV